jgi:hypothetical protein
MRTATTFGKKHGEKGEWVCISDPGIPIGDQQLHYRMLRGRQNPDYAILRYQESDGHAVEWKSRSPEQNAAAAEEAAALEKALQDNIAKRFKADEDAKLAQAQDILEAHEKSLAEKARIAKESNRRK